MKLSSPKNARAAGFTLVEAMITMGILTLVIGGTLGVFTMGLRSMYRDTARLETNASLRYFIAQVSKETLDSTEFYVFPTYESLDGSVDLSADASPSEEDAFGTSLAYGDCLLLVTRVSTEDATSNIRQFRIYYRVRKPAAAASSIVPIRYYESADYGAGGTSTSLATLLASVNLKSSPTIARSRQVVAKARGKLISGSATNCYPIFSAEQSTASTVNESVSINVEIINGTSANNMLSSSSFNYTISPRK